MAGTRVNGEHRGLAPVVLARGGNEILLTPRPMQAASVHLSVAAYRMARGKHAAAALM